ncbi:MAG: PIN domain-containing protein [Candidatus Micrarchaeia archaeon]
MILVDSCVFVAYANKDEAEHERACRLMAEIEQGKFGKPLVLDLVFAEVLTVLALKSKNKQLAVKLGETVQSAYGICFSGEELFGRTFELFKEHSKLSFADCALVAYCSLFGVQHVATFDAEFAKIPGIRVVR